MPGQRSDVLDWPYVEGLRMDEAMHPLTLLASGIYGRALAAAGRRADPAGHPVEIRFQRHQIHRQNQAGRDATAHDLERSGPERIRLLRQREPAGGPSALEPGHRAAHRRIRPAPDADVQRLRGTGRPSYTPGWTCARISDRTKRHERKRHPFRQVPPCWSMAPCRWPCWAGTACITGWERNPAEFRDPDHRHDDAGFSVADAGW